MNERILELAKQSLPAFYLTYCPSALEKFAELIVKECARVASDRVMDVEGNDWGVRWAIKNHFGVEE
jgi:hypothetical protein